MGLGPLDWMDANQWGPSLKKLGEGTPSERASVRPRGMFNTQMNGLPMMEQNIISIVMEAAFMSGAAFNPAAMKQTTIDQNAAISATKWLRSGSQTFDFEKALADELLETDVGDVPMDEVVMPYDAIYVRLKGAVVDEQGIPYDGLLVENRETPMARMIAITPFKKTGGRPIPCTMSFLPYGPDLSVAKSIESEVVRISSGSSPTQIGDVQVSTALARTIDNRLGDNIRRGNEMMKEAVLALDAILPLVVNALLYIESCKSHIRKGWPAGAPDKLAAKALDAPKGATRARDTLLRANWREAHLCTLDAEIAAGSVSGELDPDAGRHGPRTHWRRGHWRLQAHGPAKTLRKRIRIRPTVVGRQTAPEQRNYRVDEPLRKAS